MILPCGYIWFFMSTCCNLLLGKMQLTALAGATYCVFLFKVASSCRTRLAQFTNATLVRVGTLLRF